MSKRVAYVIEMQNPYNKQDRRFVEAWETRKMGRSALKDIRKDEPNDIFYLVKYVPETK